jgi:hypothetical protein
MSSTDSSAAPSTPPSSQSTPDIRVKAVIALPSLELEESYPPDEDVVENMSGLVGRVCQQFDQAFPTEEPFDYDGFRLFPDGHRDTTAVLLLWLINIPFIELDSDEEATTFRQALPQGQHKIAVIINPTPVHGSILKRLGQCLEAERKQHKLIIEEVLETAGGGPLKSSKSLPSLLKARIPSIHSHSYH